MLHILWIVLKFILILLAVILCLILAAVLLVLFCPVRYRASVMKKEEEPLKKTQAFGRVSWLFGAVSIYGSYQNESPGWDLKILGIPILKLLKRRKEKKQKASSATKASLQNDPVDARDQTAVSELKEPVVQKEPVKTDAPAMKDSDTNRKPDLNQKQDQDRKQDPDREVSEKQIEAQTQGNSFFRKLGSLARNLSIKIRRLGIKIRNLWKRLQEIPDKIKQIKRSADQLHARIKWWKCFLTHPRTQEAFALVKDKLIRLLKHIRPTKVEGNLTFSCEDPANTGKILAILGMTVPLHKNCVKVTPSFEDINQFYGNLKLKGRIYGVVLFKTALQVYFNKNIKFVIKKWKRYKEVY